MALNFTAAQTQQIVVSRRRHHHLLSVYALQYFPFYSLTSIWASHLGECTATQSRHVILILHVHLAHGQART